MASTTRALRRIQKEIADLNANPVDGISYEPAEDNLFNWKCSIKGASDSPYKGGTFYFKLVTFTTKIYHPGINEEGSICVPILRDQWKPSITLATGWVTIYHGHAMMLTVLFQVLSVIQEKVNNPSADDPFEPEIAAQLKNDKAAFLATARDWTKNKSKWSDSKSSQFPESVRSSTVSSRTSSQPSEPLPALPPVGDFRTSLILPDLSRRFTLLRAASGDHLSLDDIKNRLAEQRARGAENHLSEEEAEMFLQTLSRLRSKASSSSTSGDSTHGPASILSSEATTSSSVTSSPGSTKRYSNNMFGSGKFRDYTYMRSVTKERTGKVSAGRRSTNSALLSASGHSYKMSDPPIPEDTSQTDPDFSAHDSDTTPLASGVDAPTSELEQGIVKTFQPNHVRRVSLAVEEVMREIEEEAVGDGDDKILIPRAAAPERASSFKRRSNDTPRPTPSSSEPSVYETGTAVSPDPYSQTDAAEYRSTPSPYPRAETSPAPRLPGYIPGMPRPMTPREATFDPDEVSPSSASTPRATSPRIPDRATSPTSGIPRRDSTSTRQLHRTSSPPPTSASAPITSLLSGVNGRFTPDRSRTPDGSSVEFGNPIDSSLLGRRRPVSPFSQGTYQSMTMSSRPSTPSNVTWKASTTSGNGSAGGSRSGSAVGFAELDSSSASGLPSPLRNGFDRLSTHKRDDSNTSSTDLYEFTQLNRSGSLLDNRSLRSPALPDSPSLENGSHGFDTFSYPKRSQPSAPSNDIGSSPLTSATLRSSTPTQYAPRSPGSPAFFEQDASRNSRRGSRQATTSPFSPNRSQTPILSPLANSSRSSLESAGSSYHTWEADKQDRTLPVLAALDPQLVAWHDLSASGGDSGSPADGDVEEIVQQYAGLSKGDFVAIQERLMLAAKLKAEAPEPRERKNSIRKRRPSTSQPASGRDNGATDPTQQGSPPRAPPQDSASKASALLDSVVDSIQAPRPKPSSAPIELRTDVVAGTPTDTEPSSATRRKNALARALFGASDSERSLTSPSPQPTDGPGLSAEQPPQIDRIDSSVSSRSLRETLSPSSPSGVSSSSATEQRDTDKRQELAMEVQRRAEAAMAQLKKIPSSTKVNDGSHRKRIDPSQISGPKLVSASTSVDTIPVRSPSSASGQLQIPSPNSSKLGTRFKKLRGSLRAKPTLPSGDGSTPHPFDQPSSADRSLAGTPDGPPPFSATEPMRSKIMPPPHPATAGPGLKGFVSRFLKPRSGDMPEHERRKQMPSSSSPAPPSYFAQQQLQAERRPESFRPHTPVSPESPEPLPSSLCAACTSSVHHDGDASTAKDVDDKALRQFIDAANNLGLDQAALTEFLARSTSISSKRLTAHSSKHMSTASSDRIGHDKSNPTLGELAPLLTTSDLHHGVGQPSPRPSGDFVGKAPARRPLARKPDANAAVVRRTLIFPSEAKQSTLDPGTALRKSSSTRRRRSTSAASMHSNRSLHDRVPTPPPPKSTARRFSGEQSPPLPHIPNSLLSQTEAVNNVPQSAPAIPLEKSNSAYDSLYEMYTGDVKPAISVPGDAQSPDTSTSNNPNALHNLEPGAAVEVLELANGETIWSIVNGLRDDDEESFYGNRASFVSEYSLRDNEGVQVFFKEHGRKGSKDSQASFVSRKKPAQGSKRPETKVFFSSSAQIGRLIDNLSQGAEAGSFNILPSAHTHASRPSESSSAQSAQWTVEERLEHMLSSLGTS
ncbi:hypothetical protein EDB85DRAFT_2141550 [Lactarius pseudohatsudake]|nr:hypothetical protein EDB85DRAFT_2141550 [Lactarius pseudohatsudake]